MSFVPWSAHAVSAVLRPETDSLSQRTPSRSGSGCRRSGYRRVPCDGQGCRGYSKSRQDRTGCGRDGGRRSGRVCSRSGRGSCRWTSGTRRHGGGGQRSDCGVFTRTLQAVATERSVQTVRPAVSERAGLRSNRMGVEQQIIAGAVTSSVLPPPLQPSYAGRRVSRTRGGRRRVWLRPGSSDRPARLSSQ